MLADIQEILDAKKVIKITTSELINALCEDTEKSWATCNRGKQLSPRQLSNQLKDYGITSKTIRIGYDTAKGYEVEQFKDAFERYLTDTLILASQSNNSTEANKHAVSGVTDRNIVTVTNFQSVTLEPSPILACDVVTDKTPILISTKLFNSNDQIARF